MCLGHFVDLFFPGEPLLLADVSVLTRTALSRLLPRVPPELARLGVLWCPQLHLLLLRSPKCGRLPFGQVLIFLVPVNNIAHYIAIGQWLDVSSKFRSCHANFETGSFCKKSNAKFVREWNECGTENNEKFR